MTQQINPVKLKAAAEHLEWVCQQYPDNEDVQGLYHGLLPMIEEAKAGRVTEPVADRQDIPFRWAVSADGRYDAYKNPNIANAYVDFANEMEGGLTKEDLQLIAEIEEMQRINKKGGQS